MRIFQKTKDGGPESPVDAYFLFEIKCLGSIALLKFNKGGREAFHSHAFHALTWFICGDLHEEKLDGTWRQYVRSLIPKFTSRSNTHRVYAKRDSWCLTIRGPWVDYWHEVRQGEKVTLTHGRKEI